MKILVTGATGFIGRKLVEHLLRKHYAITCLIRKTSKVDFLKKLKVKLAVGDITEEEEVDRVFQENKPDAVFHCAANVMDKDETKLHKANVEGTRNICHVCCKHHVERLVYLSSVSVVSGNQLLSIVDDLPYKATNAYGRSKIDAERVAIEYREKGLSVAIIRPCMVCGEGEPHVLDRLLKLIFSRCFPILDVPTIDSKLNLVYVGNVVQALELALCKDEATSGTFIIADKEIITFRQVIEILYSEMSGRYPPVVPAGLAKILLYMPFLGKKITNTLKDRSYDISRAVSLLGYNPDVSTEEGLRRTVRYWKQRYV